MNVLVVGGAGYIGSHMCKMLVNDGHQVVVFDNLSTGFRHLVKYGEFVQGDLAEPKDLEALFSQYSFDAVMHFAGLIQVGESVSDPAKYYRNNVSNTLNLLDAMRQHGCHRFIFSSTAAIFGQPEYTPIDERHPTAPINPYGYTKLVIERVLQDYARAYALNSVSLRYFNACGADPEGELGECHDPETHLIPLILQAASGRRKSITVFGRDYPTADGTCIRDYIHIVDLCSAHLAALNKIASQDLKGGCFAYNLGNGSGFSVQEVIDCVRDVVVKDGCELHIEDGERREGDPAVLIADSALAREELEWSPRYGDLATIVEHAWAWEKKLAG